MFFLKRLVCNQWVLLGLALRISFLYMGFSKITTNRVEVSSPVFSIQRLKEGVALENISLSPYTGSAFHGPPLLLPTLGKLLSRPNWIMLPFVLGDLAAAGLLGATSQELLAASDPGYAAALYLMNPLTILSCIGGSLGVFENFFIILAIYGAVVLKPALSAFGLCCAGYLGLHPLTLLVPLSVLIYQGPKDHQLHCSARQGTENPVHVRKRGGLPKLLTFVIFGALWSISILALSEIYLHRFPEHACQSWIPQIRGQTDCLTEVDGTFLHRAKAKHWIREVYWFLLNVEDLSPNIGLFWYFFTEIFTEFRSFFIFVFHATAALFLIPFMIRFPDRPLLAILFQCCTNALLKPYPTIADIAMYLGILPLFPSIVSMLQWWWWLLISFLILGTQTPLIWEEWVQLGSANSNYFYAINLLTAVWEISFLVMILNTAVGPKQENAAGLGGEKIAKKSLKEKLG